MKSCTYGERTGDHLLTLYLGRKFYQEPEAAHRLPLSFEVLNSDPEYFEISGIDQVFDATGTAMKPGD